MLSVSVRSKHALTNAALVAFALVAMALFGATSAHAQADGFGNGNGQDGAASFPAGTHVPNAVAPLSAAAAVGAGSVTISAATNGSGSNWVGFQTDRLVMIYQSNGVASAPTSGSQTAYPLSNTLAGHWEFARLSAATATTLTFTKPLIYGYNAGTSQAIAVPEYTSLTTAGASSIINPQTWNGTTGGVLVMLVQNTIDTTAGGTISANGLGFRGGVSYVNNSTAAHNCGTGNDANATNGFGMKGEGFYLTAYSPTSPGTNAQRGRGNQLNGGGGGNCFNAGGGGGGGVGQGGTGGNSLNEGFGSNQPVGGLGGAAVTRNAYQQLPMGGGGGQGDRDDSNVAPGGRGGGVVLVRGSTLTGTGNFTANGAVGGNGNQGTPYDGAGGGGAGGSVMLRISNGATCGSATATGGTGGNNGSNGGNNWTPGGGGGGGAVFVQGSTISCTRTVTGGPRGTGGSNNGATAGADGAASTATTLAVTLSAPTNGTTYQTLPTNITGTGTVGSTLNLYIDGGFVTSLTVPAGGSWSYATPALTQGLHTVNVFTESGAAQSAPVSATFTYDNVAPAAPVITVPAAATTYSSTVTTYTVSGTAEANSTIRLYDGAGTGTQIGTTTTNGSGNWTLTTSSLAAGSHTIHAVAIDAGTNASADSNTKSIVVDTTAPTVNLTVPANGSATNDTTPAITFSVTDANPGSSVCIVDGGTPFACTSGSSLPALTANASHTLTIQHTDLAGNVGTSATNTFTVDATAPVAPSVQTPATPFTTNDQTPAFTGLGEPNNTIYIYVDGVLNSVSFTDGSGNWSMDLGTITPGTHSVYVTSMDAAGNTSPQSSPSRSITIDITAPTATITGPATNGTTVGPNGSFTFTTNDAVGPVTTTCQVDATPAVSCTSPFTYSGLASGPHSFTVVPTDAAGNVGTPVVRTFTVDSTPPNTNITANPAAVTNLTNASFSFTSTESPATFECVLDSDPIASCTVPKTYSGLSEGSHTFSVRAIDQYGNFDLSPASYTWTIDTTAPVAPTISTPGSDIVTSDTTPTIGGLSEPGSTVRVYDGAGTGTLVGTAVADGSGNWSLSPDPTLSSGVHTLHAAATDPAGNVSPDSSNRVITIDTTTPTVALTTPNVGTTPANGSSVNTTNPVITFTVTDANPSGASICYVDGTPTSCTSGFTTSTLSDGPHSVYVTHTDLAGNIGTSATNTFTVDTGIPAAPVITSGPSAPVASTTATFGFTGEPGATYECFIDSPVNWAPCTSGVSYTSLDQGAHTFHVRQIDAAGNTSPEATRAWSVDTVGPPAPSVSGPSGTVANTTATINFNDLESPVTYRCSLDGATATTCTDPVSLTGLGNGPHSYAVYAVDALGNAGATTTINWTVDTSLFTAGITAGPLGTVATSSNSLSFTATIVAGTTYFCKVDGGSFAPCTSSYATGALADGSHTFSVYAVNDSQTSATVTRTWTIDTAGPALTITSPTNGQLVAPNGNVTFSATDDAGPITYTCQVDAGTATSCGSPFVFTGLSDGAHSVTVVATDGVGNSSSVVRNFNVDATPPNTNITANPAAVTNSTSAAFSFTSTESPSTFECSLDGAPPTTCSSGISYSSLSQASHTFNVRAIDQYGNVDQSPASYTWTVDTTAPVAPSINNPASDLVTTDTTPSVGGLSEPNSTVRVYQGVTLIGTATTDGSGNWSLSPDPTFTEGVHALVARATDTAGNTSVDSNTRTITIDITAPVVDITSPIAGSVTSDNTPNIVFTATDTNLTLVQCSVDGGTPVTCTSPWTTPTLNDGLHTISVLAADGTGSQQTVDSVTFTVDTTAPADPDIDTPATDISTTNLRPTISGSAEPDSTVKIYDGATQIATTTADGNGDWTYTPTSDLSESAHPFHVTATDPAGNTSGNSNVRKITVDLTAPSAPAITSPASDVTTGSVRPPISGTAEPNSTVTVYDGATSIGTATTNGGGSWSFTPSSDLSEGAHAFHATATDGAGNTSGNSNIRTVTIDLTAPGAPAITTPATDITTAVNAQAIGGTAAPGSTVSVYEGATLVGTATANGSGLWSLSPNPTFSEGIHILLAYATDGAGNTSAPSLSRTITIDNTAPDKPSITSPNPGAITGDATPTVTGVAEPGSDVDVYDGATLICSTTADGSGAWSCTPSTPLPDGDHTLTAKATDSSGNESAASDPRTITIDSTAPSVSISSPVNGSTVTTGNPALVFTATDDNLDFVECKIDSSNFVVCTSGVLASGLLDGSHTATVRATDKGGNVATAATTFTVDTTAPTTTIGTKPGATDNDTTPTFTFTANDGGATFECRILPDAFAPCTSPFTSPTALGEGSHTFEVRATDTHGNLEAPAKSYTWTIDATPPAKPVVTAPVAGSTTNDDTPTISGTAEPNSSVEVFVDDVSIGTVTANGSGAWTLNSPHLADGERNVTATARDAAGNLGPESDDHKFNVDTTPPDGSVAEVPGSGGPGKTPSFDISTPDGTATIRCALDGGASSPCSAPFTPSGTLAPGTHVLVVTFTDQVGNVTTRTITFVVASVAVTPTPDDPTQCLGGGVVITNLFPKGKKATVSGFARADLVGKTVTITYMTTKKAVATAVVKSDGSFSTTFKAPPKKVWNKNSTTYQASAGSFKSKKTKLLRRTASTVVSYSGGNLTVSGSVTLPLVKGGGATIKAKTGCTGTWKAIGTTKFKANGGFSFTAPYAASGVVFVQVNAVIGNPSIKNKPFKTNSFVVPVVVK